MRTKTRWLSFSARFQCVQHSNQCMPSVIIKPFCRGALRFQYFRGICVRSVGLSSFRWPKPFAFFFGSFFLGDVPVCGELVQVCASLIHTEQRLHFLWLQRRRMNFLNIFVKLFLVRAVPHDGCMRQRELGSRLA